MPITKSLQKLRREAEKRNESMPGGRLWRLLDFFTYFLMIILIMLAVRSVVADPVRVDGRSMQDTLENGDVMLVDRLAYAFSSPKRGDIVICYYPDAYYTDNELKYATRVKRVVAVAGDTIEIKDGGVYVNGVFLDEPYLNGRTTPQNSLDGYEETAVALSDGGVVPEGTVFVMGDNRPVSRDSRNEKVGAIPLERVIGKVRLVVLNLDQTKSFLDLFRQMHVVK